MSEKKKIRSKFFRKLTPEREAELRKQSLETRAALSIAYQLGYYVGEQIVDKFLPTLSCDMLQTRKVISVTCAEGDECKRLDAAWYHKRTSIKGSESEQSEASQEEWKALRAYHEMLEEKYLPPTVNCHFSVLNITEENMQDFKKGIGASLWDCDCSHYSTKPEDIIVQADDEGWFTNITIIRK